ncbi:MAG: hypothetical protein ACUVV4_06505 [Candidatus Bathyarchaeia archaeon]
MSEYQIGAYEALEWVWFMLRNQVNNPGGVEKARQLVFETLTIMGGGRSPNFSEKISEAKSTVVESRNIRHLELKAYCA